jgi:putative transposase
MEKFDSLSHAKLSLCYHIVLATKYRRPCLEELEQSVYASIFKTLKEMHVRIEGMAIDHGDHIHLMIRSRIQG